MTGWSLPPYRPVGRSSTGYPQAKSTGCTSCCPQADRARLMPMTHKCCHMPTVGTAAVTLPGKEKHTVKWCEDHLEWAREEFTLLLVKSVFPGSTIEPSERLF